MHSGRIGSLSTLSRKQPGFPFGSLMPYALDGQGRPIFLISTMAMHTQNLQADPRASLFVTEPDASGNPLGASRVTLIGNVIQIPEPDLGEARSLYLEGYPDSKYWIDFDDFSFYRMDVLDVYYVGGFGVMGWVAASEYSQANSDPLVEHKIDIMQHMNADLQRICSELALPGDLDIAQISWRPDYDPFFYRQLSRRARRIYLFRDEYIFDVEKAVIVETPELGHATYVFTKPRSMDTFLALYTKITKDDIRRNRNNTAERLGFLGRVIHGTNPRAWLKEVRQRVGEGIDFAAAARGGVNHGPIRAHFCGIRFGGGFLHTC